MSVKFVVKTKIVTGFAHGTTSLDIVVQWGTRRLNTYLSDSAHRVVVAVCVVYEE